MNKILVYPNKILRVKGKNIEVLGDEAIKQIKDLKEQLEKGENAAGLAAPQVGISKNFFGIKDRDGKVEIFINPKLIRVWGEKVYPKIVGENNKEEDFLEGCLSFPNIFGTVKRFLKIEVSWLEPRGKNFVSKIRELSGFEAIVWQHENDHLEGKLLIDHLKNEGGKVFKWDGKEMVKWNVEKI